jgi:hypothetical protein
VDTNTHRTIEELNGAVLPIESAAKLYREGRLTTFPGQRVGTHVPGATAAYNVPGVPLRSAHIRLIFKAEKQSFRGLGYFPVGRANRFLFDRLPD